MGHMQDFSKGECLRVANDLKKRVEQGKVVKVKRGVYQIKIPEFPDREFDGSTLRGTPIAVLRSEEIT